MGVNIETSRPRALGTGITVTVWREVKGAEDEGREKDGPSRASGFKKGDTILEPVSVLVTVDKDGKTTVDDDVWEELCKNGQQESFGLVKSGRGSR